MAGEIEDLQKRIREFVKERDWEKFHSPKNLAVSLALEAAELLEAFQWTDPSYEEISSDEELLQRVREELADIPIYLLNLFDRLAVSPVEATREKILANADRYPAEVVRGSAVMYPSPRTKGE